jgi:hypothetical protein
MSPERSLGPSVSWIVPTRSRCLLKRLALRYSADTVAEGDPSMHRLGALVVGVVLASLLAGCGAVPAAQITIVNRSNAVLTAGPGVIIPACGSTTTSLVEYAATRNKAAEMAFNGQTWDAPPDALMWSSPAIAVARGTIPTGMMTIVVSSSADVDVRAGAVAEDELPACGGQPRLELLGPLDSSPAAESP